MNNEIKTKKIYDRYEITSDGKIFSLIGNKKELKPNVNKCGYHDFSICINKKRHHKKIHRLVAEAFIPNPNNYLQIMHLNGDKTNNNLNNLAWCTAKQNMLHARDIGLTVCKINMKVAEEIRKLYKTKKYKQKELCEMFNLGYVSRIINNKTWVK